MFLIYFYSPQASGIGPSTFWNRLSKSSLSSDLKQHHSSLTHFILNNRAHEILSDHFLLISARIRRFFKTSHSVTKWLVYLSNLNLD